MHQKPCKTLGGYELRRAREETGKSQSLFAVQNGYNPSTLSLWETGRTVPDLINAIKMFRDFGIEVEWWYRPAPREQPPRSSAGESAAP